ncbi:PEP-CTERM sorting domain-containing protein [Planctomycetota bacterium]|nr:PEP-CTERM sorting domain-containing protein [Planctomycetota bacterium]
MRKAITFAAAIAATGLTAATASAALIDDSAPFAFPLSPATQTVALDQFDPALGTLISVTIEIEGEVTADITAENDSVLDAPGYQISLTANFEAVAPGTSAVVALNDAWAQALVATDGVPGSGADFHDFGTLSDDNSNSNSIVSGLAPYIGTGTIDVDVNGSAGFSFSGTTDSSLDISNLAGEGEVTVIYNYIPIPEPASMALLGLGGVAILARRKK